MLSNLVTILPTFLYGGIILLVDLPSSPPPPMYETSPSSIVVPSSSSNAARLLMDTPGGPISSTTRNKLAMQQLFQQRVFQDDRLGQCEEKVEDFEQCFFYGTGDTSYSLTKQTKSKVPTW